MAKITYPIGKQHYKITICDHVLDTVYGQIGLTEVEKEIERLSIFKRLHNISQLGLVNWIFPCALHTRYTHSIGVMHVASQMANHINANTTIETPFFDDDEIQIIRLAGLLHDIGHYPMSHNVERAYKEANSLTTKEKSKKTPTQRLATITKCPDFLNPLSEKGSKVELTSENKDELLIAEEDYFKSFNGSTGFHHEKMGMHIIISNKAIHDAVRNHFVLLNENNQIVVNPKFVSDDTDAETMTDEMVDSITNSLLVAIGEMVRGNYENKTPLRTNWLKKYSAMIQLIHSELDADNIDYLVRDATFSGTSYGTMDMGVLLNSLTVTKLKNTNENIFYIVGIMKKGLGSVEQFLLNKYLAYTQMILSKYVSILEAMLYCFEADYVIASENNEDYNCDNLLKMVSSSDSSLKFYSFSDYYIFQNINSFKKNATSMKALPKAIVSQLSSLRAFNLDTKGQNEILCTGFTKEELYESITKSEIYQKFKELCFNLQKTEQSTEINDKEAIYEKNELKLFLFRFEQYNLTKQIPLEEFKKKYNFDSMELGRKFLFHFYRLADGIPVIEKDQYSLASLDISENSSESFDILKLCVDCQESCLHKIYSMQYLTLRHYQIDE